MRILAALSVLAFLLLTPASAAAGVTYGQDYRWIDTTFNVVDGPTAFPITVSQTGGGTNGQSNTGLGWWVLNANTTGQSNTAIGYYALVADTTGAYNTVLGANTLALNTTGANNVAIGYNVASATLNGGSGNILIGTSSAVTTVAAGTNYNLNIGNLLQGDMTYSTALGTEALYLQSMPGGVDFLEIAGGASGSPGNVTISSQGSDTDVNMTLTPKGAGVLTVNTTTAVALPAGTTGQRPTGVNGMIRYNGDSSGSVEAYINGSWTPLLTSGGSTTITLGTSATTTNPQRSGQATTGFYSAATNTVSVAAGGIEAEQWNTLASGVDYLSITPGKSGTAPQIAVAGSTSPQNLNLAPVGTTGVIQFSGNTMFWQDATNANLAVGATAFPTTVSQSGGGNNGLDNTAVGYQALNANTTGYWNTAIGYQALFVNTTGASNTAVGMQALYSNTTGNNNTAVGRYALQRNTTGIDNTAVGLGALFVNTTGVGNTAVGWEALINNVTGSGNTAVGQSALAFNTTGNNNTALGYAALYKNTTGTYNTAVGLNALYVNTTGMNNTVLGYGVASATLNGGSNNILIGVDNTTDTYSATSGTTIGIGQGVKPGTNDIAIGYQALNATAGDSQQNTAIGYQALKANTTGTQNTAVGYVALKANTTGFNNTAVGALALFVNTTGASNTAVGWEALLDNTTGGENTAVGQSALGANSTGYYNTAIGYQALLVNTTGIENTAMGFRALYVNTTGTNNTVLGYSVASGTLNGGSNNILIGTSSAVTTVAAGTNYNLNIGNLLQGDMTYSTALGTEALYLQSMPGGVDFLEIAGGASGSPGNVTISSQGSDTDVSMTLTPKGAGVLTVNTTTAFALPAGTTGQRPTGVNGMIRYNGDSSGSVEAYINGSWTPLLTSGGSTITLGTSASTTNPQRSGQATTGFYSAATNTVAVAAGGIEAEQWNTIASGVDYLSITPGKSGTAPQIAVAGSTSPQNLNLAPVGTTGVIQFSGNTMFWEDTTNFNMAVGATALPSTISQTGGGSNGQYNTAVGYQALNANTTGYWNTAVGALALANNSIGEQNTAFGVAALYHNTASGNLAIGFDALFTNTGGFSDTAVGYHALYTNNGSYNTALGYQTLESSTTGTRNTAMGHQAAQKNTTGSFNTVIGFAALNANTTGASNTAIGYEVASVTLNGGSNNILIGTSSAVDTAAAGTNYNLNIGNLLQGDMTNVSTTAGSGNLATLYLQSTASGVDYLQIAGGKSGTAPQIAVAGSTSPQNLNLVPVGAAGVIQFSGNTMFWQDATNDNLAVGATALPTTVSQTGGFGYGNVAVGQSALNTNTTGRWNTAVGYTALSQNTTAYGNTAVGYIALANNTNIANTAVGYGALSTNTAGYDNTAVGYGALTSNTIGYYNTAVGLEALLKNTTGIDNTAIGMSALFNNTTGSNNTVLGYNAASTTLNGGSNNILIGTSSAVDTAAAGTNYNLNIGNLLQGDMTYSTATYNTTLYLQSVASGANYLQIAGSTVAAGIGAHGTATVSAQGSNSNIDIILTPKSGYVGVATSSPKATLDVNGYARLTLQSSQPVACAAGNAGAIALNHLAQMCACNGSAWIFADSVGAACSW